MGQRQFVECVPDAMPGHLEMPCSLRLCPIGMDFHMTAQGVPIQFVGSLWAGALVGEAAGLELAVDAGFAHREPPSRLGFASTIAHKIHHPLTQV